MDRAFLILIIVILPIRVLGQNSSDIDSSQIYLVVDSMPTMPNGIDIATGFRDLFNKEFKYPDSINCLISTIIFEFVISYNGVVINKKITFRNDFEDCEGDYKKLRKSGLLFLDNFPKCNPGKHNGKFVNVKFYGPVSIHLQ